MSSKEKVSGRFALTIAHVAGMVDLVALPVWIAALISAYNFDTQQAGGIVTLFLVGAVIASVILAPMFNRFSGRAVATIGFAAAAVIMGFASTQTAFGPLAIAHFLAGVSVGSALSFTHGTMGRSLNPHRMFAIAGTALGIFAIVFLGATPQVIATQGGSILFVIFAGLMAIAALVSLLLFPKPAVRSDAAIDGLKGKFGRPVWAGIIGVSLMAFSQSMMFAFFQQLGEDRGFGLDAVTGVLIALGFVNLFPAPAAAFLEKKLNAQKVAMTGPVLQAILALVITLSGTFLPYALAGSVYVAVMIFTHTFAFGLLSRLDPSGRAVASTPAMLMIGSAVGPILGGTLIKFSGYPALGFTVCVVAVIAVAMFSQAKQEHKLVAAE